MAKKHGNTKKFNWEVFDGMLQFKPSKKVCADYLGVSEATIDNKLKKDKKATFSDYRDIKMGTVKLKLQQKAIQMAMSGHPTMMIFCLKNLCDWADKVENNNTNKEVTGIVFVEKEGEE